MYMHLCICLFVCLFVYLSVYYDLSIYNSPCEDTIWHVQRYSHVCVVFGVKFRYSLYFMTVYIFHIYKYIYIYIMYMYSVYVYVCVCVWNAKFINPNHFGRLSWDDIFECHQFPTAIGRISKPASAPPTAFDNHCPQYPIVHSGDLPKNAPSTKTLLQSNHFAIKCCWWYQTKLHLRQPGNDDGNGGGDYDEFGDGDDDD